MQISIYLFDFDSRALNFSRGLGKINNGPLHSGENEVAHCHFRREESCGPLTFVSGRRFVIFLFLCGLKIGRGNI